MKCFGPFRLDSANHCLWRAEERISMTPKAFDVLRFLVERTDRLVTQEEILEGLWPEIYVNPEGVRKYILEIRKVLGDQPNEPLFIETLPKRGYQFIAKVTEEQLPSRTRVPSTTVTNIVGRDAALAELHKHFETAQTGRRQVIFVTGEAGIGKTTLVDVFQEQVARHPTLLLARGQCIEGFGGTEAYYPMLEAVGSLLSRAKDASLVELFARRAPTWLAQFPSLVTAEQSETLQREILGSTRGRMVREICEAIEGLCAKDPLIVLLEDLHWADASTLDLVSALARRRERAKLLVIGTYRPVDVVLSKSPLRGLKHDLLLHQLCHELTVERLEDFHVAEYLAKEFAGNDFPSGLAQLIHHNSGGNALFIVAIVRDILKRGLIAQDREGWHLTAPLQEVYPRIPDTLQQMLDLQFEQLSGEEQRILRACTVAGERFSVWAAAAVLEVSTASIDETCERLAQRQQFIRFVAIDKAADDADSAHYEFRHALYRQALYRGLSGVNRSKLHRSLGERLMPICMAGKPELASEAALHFEEGRDYKRAARCLMLAAENAARRFSYRDSIQILRHALELVDALPLEDREGLDSEILRRVGDAHYALGEISESASSYEAAALLATRTGSKTSQISSLVHLAVPLLFVNPERGGAVCQEALDMSGVLVDPVFAAQVKLGIASLRLLNDTWTKEDVALCTEAREKLRGLCPLGLLPDVYDAYVLSFQGSYREADRKADLLLNTTANPATRVIAHGAKQLAVLFRGRIGEMLRTIRAERALAESNGEDPWIWLLGEAWVRALSFDFEGVHRVSKISVRSDTERHAAWTRAISVIATGYGEFYAGNLETALQCFDKVRDFRSTPKFFLHWHWRLHAELGAAEALLHAGDIARAGSQADRFLQATLSTAEPNMQAHAWDVKSRAAIAARDYNSAVQCIHNALALIDRFEIPLAGWQVHRTAWNLHAALGDPEKAGSHRARATHLIMSIADSFEPGEPLRNTFLSATPVSRVLGSAASA